MVCGTSLREEDDEPQGDPECASVVIEVTDTGSETAFINLDELVDLIGYPAETPSSSSDSSKQISSPAGKPAVDTRRLVLATFHSLLSPPSSSASGSKNLIEKDNLFARPPPNYLATSTTTSPATTTPAKLLKVSLTPSKPKALDFDLTPVRTPTHNLSDLSGIRRAHTPPDLSMSGITYTSEPTFNRSLGLLLDDVVPKKEAKVEDSSAPSGSHLLAGTLTNGETSSPNYHTVRGKEMWGFI